MEYRLRLTRDDHNTYPDGTCLIVREDKEEVVFKISDDDREVSVSRGELLRVLTALGAGVLL